MQITNETKCSDNYSSTTCDCDNSDYQPTAITILLNFIATNESDVAFCFILFFLNISQLCFEYSKTIDYKHSLQMDKDRMKIAILNLILTFCSIIHYFIWCIIYFTFV